MRAREWNVDEYDDRGSGTPLPLSSALREGRKSEC